jgi:hypothetical protein
MSHQEAAARPDGIVPPKKPTHANVARWCRAVVNFIRDKQSETPLGKAGIVLNRRPLRVFNEWFQRAYDFACHFGFDDLVIPLDPPSAIVGGSPLELTKRLLLLAKRCDAADVEEKGATKVTANDKTPASTPKAGVNARMIETIQSNHEAMGWTCTQWAKHLRCGKSTVAETKTWKDITMARDRKRAELATDRRWRRRRR